MRAYLDHNATSALRPEAWAAMEAALGACGNPSSVHAEGQRARALVEEAREAVERLVGAPARSVIFTSGGTEGNNLAILGSSVDRIIVSAVEHPSVLEAARRSDKPVTVLPVDAHGIVDPAAVEAALAEGGGRALVSIMLANNETGVIQPIQSTVAIASRHGALVHTDAVQAAGKLPVSFGSLGVDLMSLSAHKLGGPVGVGALVVRDGLAVEPRTVGGGQELRRRAGTENVAGISGFGAAAGAAASGLAEDAGRMTGLRERLEAEVAASAFEAHIFGQGAERLPNTVCFGVSGFSAEFLLMALDLEGVAVSSGSACSSGKVARSHVLAAMGVPDDVCGSALRVSLGWNSTEADIDRFLRAWRKIRDVAGGRRAA